MLSSTPSNSVKKSQPTLPISTIDERLQQYTQATEVKSTQLSEAKPPLQYAIIHHPPTKYHLSNSLHPIISLSLLNQYPSISSHCLFHKPWVSHITTFLCLSCHLPIQPVPLLLYNTPSYSQIRPQSNKGHLLKHPLLKYPSISTFLHFYIPPPKQHSSIRSASPYLTSTPPPNQCLSTQPVLLHPICTTPLQATFLYILFL